MSYKKILSIVNFLLVILTLSTFAGNKEQILYKANGAEPKDLDPQIITGLPEWQIVINIYEGLISLDQKTLAPLPGVALHWEISKDGRIYTFHLRDNAYWSNGKKLTAHDFVYSFERILNPKLASEYAYQVYYIKNAKKYNTGELKDPKAIGVKAINAKTLQITLDNPTPFFLQVLSHHAYFPVNKDVVTKHGTQWTKPGNIVTNGAYRVIEWKPQDVIIIEKNPYYWDKDNIKISKAYLYATENIDTQEKLFESGKVHWTYELAAIKVPKWQKTNSLQLNPQLGVNYYNINVKKPPLNNKLVRQALSLAIDREKIIKHVLKDARGVPYSLTPAVLPCGYEPPKLVEFNPEKAKKLLAQAGYPNGKGFPKFELLFNTHEDHRKIALATQQMWKQNLGIDIGMYNQEWKVYLDTLHAIRFDLARGGWIGDYADPNTFLDLHITGGGNNNTGWSNKEYDRLIESAAKEQDNKKRNEYFYKAETLLLEEMPVIPIFVYKTMYLLSPKVKGFYANIMDYHPIKNFYLEDDKQSVSSNIKRAKK